MSLADQPHYGSRAYSTRPSHYHDMSATYRSNYRRKLYPPPPSVEDEATALSHEYPPSATDDSDDTVPSRGTVDQDSLLDLVDNPERRYVLFSDYSSSSRPRRLSNRNTDAPPLTLDVDPTLLDRRQSTPYTFTPASTAGRDGADSFLSPDAARHPSSARRPSPAKTSPSRAPRESNRGRKSDQSDDSEVDQRNKSSNRRPLTESTPKLPRKVSFAGPDDKPDPPRRDTSRTAVHAAAAAAVGIGAAAVGEHAATGRPSRGRNTENASGRGANTSERAEYLEPRASGISETLSTPSTPSPGSAPFRRDHSGPDSPQGHWDRLSTAEQPRFPVPFDLPTHPRPRNPPRSSSQIPPGASGLPNQDYYRSPYPDDYGQGGSGLPYPDENPSISMPEHMNFQYMPPDVYTADTARSFPHAASPSTNATMSNDPLGDPYLRPRNAPPMSRSGSRSDNDNARSQRPNLSSRSLPWFAPCPRTDYVSGFHDWYYLEGNPDFHVCPSCRHEIIDPTRFRQFFKPSSPHSTDGSIRCDFGKPWVRVAFLQCTKYHDDLHFISDIVELSREERPCHGHEEAVRTWYGMVDNNGEFIPNFYVCPIDKANIEILFSSLEGAFVRRPPSRNKHVCSLRSGGRRFLIYVNLLDALHDDALHAAHSASAAAYGRRPTAAVQPVADLKPLQELAATIASMPECPRDKLVPADTPWHVLTSYPDTTVCRECYSEVVRPAALQGSRVAAAFAREPQPLSPSAGATAPPTCQLYSARMLAVWERAVREDDLVLLVRCIRERRAMEVDVKRRRVDLERLMRSVSARVCHGPVEEIEREEDLELVLRKLEKNEDEWKAWE